MDKVFLEVMHHKMEILLVVVEVELLKQELIHQDHRVRRLSQEEVEQEHQIVFQDQHFLMLAEVVAEQVIMEHQDQGLLEQLLHVEQVELELKLIVELEEPELLIEVVAVVELEVHIIHPIITVVEQVVQE
jgi:hypothetical protein